MTKLLAFSGKKQSGKTTSANFLYGSVMKNTYIDGVNGPEPLVDYADIDQEGRLILPGVINNDTQEVGPVVFPTESTHPGIVQYMSDFVWPNLQTYSFADILKQMCINLLGLTHEQCYGSDEQKNTKTDIRWDNIPGFITEKLPELDEDEAEEIGSIAPYYYKTQGKLKYHPKGFMTGREVLQIVGTQIFRKLRDDVWVQATIGRILRDAPALAVVTDCRFPNEVKGIQEAGGKVIRLTRNPNPNDEHVSETALDKDNFDWDDFDYVLDNATDSIETQNQKLYDILTEWEFIDYEKTAGTIAVEA